MAHAVHETTYDVDAAQLFSAVTDFEKYPEFVEGMKKVTVDRSGSELMVHYDLSMMGKDMSYTLRLIEEPEKGHLSWSLFKSEFFKVNNGDWLIQSLGPGKCKARYFSEVDFTFPVPGFVLKPMVTKAVPKMMDSFYHRAKTLPMPEVSPTASPVKAEEAVVKADDQSSEVAQSVKADETQKTAGTSTASAKEKPVTENFQKSSTSYSWNEEKTEHKHGYKTMNDQHDSGILSWAKKIMTVGVGTFFLTEESLKTMISEFKLPKEMMGTILDGAKSVRQEFMQNVVHEVIGKVGEKMDPAAVLAEFLKKNDVTFEIKIKVKEKTDTGV